jgi:ribosome biogenesis GTPase
LDGDWSRRRLERYVARVAASGASATIVFSKADLLEQRDALIDEVSRGFPDIPHLFVSTATGEGVAEVRAAVIGAGGSVPTTALVGSSGVGKSTLVNALLGEGVMKTGEVRQRDRRGCHVTSHRQMLLLSDEEGIRGIVVDTPGMRELALCEDDGLDVAFADLAAWARQCRFRDCQHRDEPGCAVGEAIAAGVLEAERLAHHQLLRDDAAFHERRTDVRQRRAADRAFGKACREGKLAARRKG